MLSELTQLTFLANQCRVAKLDQDFLTANKFWALIEPALTKQLYGIALKLDWNASNQLDLAQEAASAIWSKMEIFDPLQSKNARCPFTSWAYMQGRFAMIEHLRKNGLSRIQRDHKKLIMEKLTSDYPKGPLPGTTWLDLAKEHLEELACPPDLTSTMVLNTLAAWSLVEAGDIEDAGDIALGTHPSTLTWLDIEEAMNHLGFDPRKKLFTQQRLRCELAYEEIAEKYNQTQPPPKKLVSKGYAKKLVSLAIIELRKYFGG